ncbi:MAG: hypothetical protein R3F65_10135 [bacterium]|nr:hypothetical protein [Myxococcales bacterium]
MRKALRSDSFLQPLVADGLGAVTRRQDRECFDAGVRADFADSLDADAALAPAHPDDNRWDFLLGHAPSGEVIAVEVHSAKNDQIGTLIKKRERARVQLRPHLRDGATISRWLWVASGTVQFAPFDRATLQLAQNGIGFVGRRLLAKHLPPR